MEAISRDLPSPVSSLILHLFPEFTTSPFSSSTKQLELWFSSLQDDAGQKLRWEGHGTVGLGEERLSCCSVLRSEYTPRGRVWEESQPRLPSPLYFST